MLKHIFYIFIFIIITSCTADFENFSSSQRQYDLGENGDPDKDGLINKLEWRYSTSMFLSDTDGDGKTDFDEIAESNYLQNHKALIADYPRLGIELISDIKFQLDYTTSESGAKTIEMSLTDSKSDSKSRSTSSSSSNAISHGWNVEVHASATIGITGGATFGGSAGANGQYTTDTSTGVDLGTIQDITKSIEERISDTETYEKTYTRSELRFTVRVINESIVGLKAKELKLNIEGIVDNKRVVLASGLGVDSSVFILPARGSTKIEFVLPIASEQFEYIKALSSPFINISIASVDIEGPTVETSSGFLSSLELSDIYTRLASRVATLEINYSSANKLAEKYSLATNRKYDSLGDLQLLSLKEWVNVAGIPKFIYDGNNITSVNGVDSDSARKWSVYVFKTNSSGREELIGFSTFKKSSQDDFFNTFKISSGIRVIIIIGADEDEDGLITYFENQYDTDPYNADTDGDGISDRDEIVGYIPQAIFYVSGVKEVYPKDKDKYNQIVTSNPKVADYDGDGLGDAVDLYPAKAIRSQNNSIKTKAKLNGKDIDLIESKSINEIDDNLSWHEVLVQVGSKLVFDIDCKDTTKPSGEEELQNILTIEEQRYNISNSFGGSVGKIRLYIADGTTPIAETSNAIVKDGKCSYQIESSNISSIGKVRYRFDVYAKDILNYQNRSYRSYYAQVDIKGTIGPIKITDYKYNRSKKQFSVDYQVKLDSTFKTVYFRFEDNSGTLTYKRATEEGIKDGVSIYTIKDISLSVSPYSFNYSTKVSIIAYNNFRIPSSSVLPDYSNPDYKSSSLGVIANISEVDIEIKLIGLSVTIKELDNRIPVTTADPRPYQYFKFNIKGYNFDFNTDNVESQFIESITKIFRGSITGISQKETFYTSHLTGLLGLIKYNHDDTGKNKKLPAVKIKNINVDNTDKLSGIKVIDIRVISYPFIDKRPIKEEVEIIFLFDKYVKLSLETKKIHYFDNKLNDDFTNIKKIGPDNGAYFDKFYRAFKFKTQNMHIGFSFQYTPAKYKLYLVDSK